MNRSFNLSPRKKIYSSLPTELEENHSCERERTGFSSAADNISSYRCTPQSISVDDKKYFSTEKKVKNEGNDDVFTLRSWNSAASVRPIENDEWQVFLLRSMEELMSGQLDCLRNHNLVSVVMAPLRNPNASCKVLEYVANMLSLPFVVHGLIEKDIESIKQVYLEIKVVPNLLYASKIISKSKRSDIHSSHSLNTENDFLASVSELNADELQALESIYLLICHLVHSGSDFVLQLCDAMAIFNAVSLLQQLLLLGGRKMRIVTDLLAIMNLILQTSPENADLVEQIIIGITNTGEQYSNLSKLLTHPSQVIRSRACLLIRRLAFSKPSSLTSVMVPKIYQDFITLLSDPSASIRADAEAVLKELKKIQS